MNSKRFWQIIFRQTTSLLAYLFIIVRPKRYGLNKNNRKECVIVSMTSYKPRLKFAYLALKSLLFQTYKPDKIILYIEKKDGLYVGRQLKKLINYGISIEERDDAGLGSHKKYYYALREYHNDLVITVDDDMIYRNDLIERLVDKYNLYPTAVCAKRVHKISLNTQGIIEPYEIWEKECKSVKEPSYALCATTGAGTLYPPGIMPEIAFDENLIKKFALYCDDIWLKYIETANGIKIVRAEGDYDLSYIIQIAQRTGLRHKNIEECRNDESIRALDTFFKIDWIELFHSENE